MVIPDRTMKKTFVYISAVCALFVPALVFAANGDIFSFVDRGIEVINDALVPLILALAFIVFIWGTFRYFILDAGKDEGREKARNLMIYGMIGFFVIVSVWGLVNILVRTFDLDNRAPDPPQLDDGGSSLGGRSFPIPVEQIEI